MIFGKFALGVSFLLFLSATLYFIFAEIKSNKNYARRARALFLSGGLSVLFLVLLLFFLIFTHQFQYSFVYQYSSVDLPYYYLFSTFWAGQAGTFLMWALFSSIYGIVLIRSQKPPDNSIILAIIALALVFLIVLTMKVNPFEYVWVTSPETFSVGQIPLDGRGLNPLLQDYWMVIHPPILFLGYSSTLMPFAFVISRLFRGKDKNFISSVQPWALFNLLILGVGIILGGYWAYTTLGWGGYWAWDPVENSSLVPWLFSLAYAHGLIIEKRRGSFVKTNLFLGALPFLAMLYGSFLTRSGVLADFSVHSFIDQGINIFLVMFLLSFVIIFVVSMFLRINKIDAKPMQVQFFIRENFLGYGILITTIFAMLIFIGTSSPLLTLLFSDNAANVSMEYYSIIGTSIIILMLLLIGFTPYLPWKNKNGIDQKNIFAIVFFISVIATIVALFSGLNILISVPLFFASVFALILNARLLYVRAKNNFWLSGAFLAHTGLALMVIGIITSSLYGDSMRIAVPEMGSERALDYTFEFKGMIPGDRGQDFAEIIVKKGDDRFIAHPKFYFSDYTRSYMTTPHVKNYWDHDLYIAPIQILDENDIPAGEKIELKKGELVKMDSITISLQKLSMQRLEDNARIKAMAHITVQVSGDSVLLIPAIIVNKDQRELVPAIWEKQKIELRLAGMNVDEQKVSLYLQRENAKKQTRRYLVLDISEKPFISVLWVGTFLLIGGILLAFLQKRKRLSSISF